MVHDLGMDMSLVPTVIPIFPLPGVVLLPSEVLPLHIFERRYREMVKDALESEKLIGMVEIDSRKNPASIGHPPVEPIGCLGVIGRHHELDDGRFLLWLFGVKRFLIDHELEVETPYRQASVTYSVFKEGPAELAQMRPMVDDLRRALPSLVDVEPEARAEMVEVIASVDGPQLLPLACRILEMQAQRKRQVLEAGSFAEALLMVYQDVNDTLQATEGNPFDRGVVN